MPRQGLRPALRLALGLAAVLASAGLVAAACTAPPSDTDEPREEAPEEPRGEPRAEPRRMAITVDDLPVAPPGTHTTAQQAEITERLLAALADHGAPAIGFVNEAKLEEDGAVDPLRVALLERWLEAGHELGNHGYAHLDLHRVDADAWLADALRGERVTRPLVEGRGRELRWFRHPFLHTGRSVEVLERTTRALAELGYRVAPVTVDNGEWIYGGAYADAWNQGDLAALEPPGSDYVRYMLEVVDFYEAQSREIAGELIPQTLLIHAYALNADWLDRLLDALEARGYRWITLEEATAHPAYERPTHGHTGAGGITWLHRWAITEGRDPAIFRGEPEVPAWVRERQLESRLPPALSAAELAASRGAAAVGDSQRPAGAPAPPRVPGDAERRGPTTGGAPRSPDRRAAGHRAGDAVPTPRRSGGCRRDRPQRAFDPAPRPGMKRWRNAS